MLRFINVLLVELVSNQICQGSVKVQFHVGVMPSCICLGSGLLHGQGKCQCSGSPCKEKQGRAPASVCKPSSKHVSHTEVDMANEEAMRQPQQTLSLLFLGEVRPTVYRSSCEIWAVFVRKFALLELGRLRALMGKPGFFRLRTWSWLFCTKAKSLNDLPGIRLATAGRR